MFTRPILLARLVVAALAAASLPSVASAQSVGPATFDGYASRIRLDGGSNRTGMNAVGARLAWPVTEDAESPSLLSRTAFGLFGEYAPDQDRGFTLLHLGAHGELRPLRAPYLGRFEPMLSLGVGAFTTRSEPAAQPNLLAFPVGKQTTTTFAVSPGVGARVRLWRGLGLAADLRDIMTFRGESQNNLTVSGGLSLRY